MLAVDLIDETFIVCNRPQLAEAVSDPRRWRAWWPDLNLLVFMDRGLDGIRWSMTGDLVGSCEIWLEEVLDGVMLHYYLRGESGIERPGRSAQALRRRRAVAWKAHAWALKDELEVGRRPGEPRDTRGAQQIQAHRMGGAACG